VNLEQLRKQAKEHVRAARSGDTDALARLGDLPPKLASAQLVLAREHGFRSWPELVHALEATADAFVVAATSGRRDRAERLLAARPEIERDRWARLVVGRGPRAVEMPHLPHAIPRSVVALVDLGRADPERRLRQPRHLEPGGECDTHDVVAREPCHVLRDLQA